MQALRIAARSLSRRPSYTLTAVVTLALGLGATAGVFSVVHSVVLSPLPYPAPEELVRVEHPVPGLNPEWVWGLSEAGWWTLREGSESFEDLGVYAAGEVGLAGEEVAEPVVAASVTANVPELLGAGPVLGRGLRWEDNAPAAASVMVLGHEFWRTRFGSDPTVVGRALRLEGRPVQVVGVMAEGAVLPDREVDIWLPLAVSRDRRPVNAHWLQSVGRLREGVDVAAAERELSGLVSRFPEALPEAYSADFVERTAFDVRAVPLREHVVGDMAGTLWMLLAAVGLVLVIACVNVASLLLVRLETMRRERAVREALGAGWLDRVRVAMAESVVLTGAACVLGVVLGWWGLDVLVRLAPDLPRLEEVALGWQSVGIMAAVTAGVAVLFGLMGVRSGGEGAALREGAGVTWGRRSRAIRSGLVVAEIALALVLACGAALMVRTSQNLRAVDPGFDATGVLTVQVALPYATYPDDGAVMAFYRDLTIRAGALPGVQAAGATQALPLTSGTNCALLFPEDPAAAERSTECFASTVRVTPGYFEAMGIPVQGRTPTWDDMAAQRGGVVVSRSAMDHLWPGEEPAGQGVRGNGPGSPYYRVEGVAGPVRGDGLAEPAIDRVYFPMLPLEGAPLWNAPRDMTLTVRTGSSRPTALAEPIRELIRELDPTAAIGGIRTMEDVVRASTARTSFVMILLGASAAVALLLGVIGVYGLIAHVVEQRRPEIGIRIALGARKATVRAMVLRQAAWLTGAGTLLGIVAATLSTRVLASLLFEVTPADPLALAAATTLMMAVALAAALIPAARAARMDPMRALRGD